MTFLGENFFPSKMLEFLHVPFNLVVKHSVLIIFFVQAFLKEKKFHPKKSLSIVLHQAIQLDFDKRNLLLFRETMKSAKLNQLLF